MNTTKGNETKRRTLVLFDVGGVLLKLDFGRFYEEASKLSESLSPRDFKNLYLSSNLEALFLSGKINTPDYLNKVSDIISPGKSIPQNELKRVVSYCWKEPVEEMIELKRRVYEAGYSIGIFSNISELAVEVISGIHSGIFETFKPSFPSIFSFQIGSMKPKPEMYQRITGYNKVILIDDKTSYLSTGIKKFGWFGILFTPFIDEAEAIRFVHNTTTKPLKNFRTADSVKAVIESLKYFGVEV